MTAVRQAKTAPRKAQKPTRTATERTRTAKKAAPTARTASAAGSGSQVAQVRLQPDELDALHVVMAQLHLASTSEALREGIRLLTREAAEVSAADDIRSYYGGEQAPLPDGVVAPTEEELAAADAEQW